MHQKIKTTTVISAGTTVRHGISIFFFFLLLLILVEMHVFKIRFGDFQLHEQSFILVKLQFKTNFEKKIFIVL